MKLKTLLIGAAAGFLALSAAVFAQVSVPQLTTLRQTDLIQIIVGGQPSAQSRYASIPGITNVTGYYASSPGTQGLTYTFTAGVTNATFAPVGTVTYGYFTLVSNPSDGAVNCIFSTQAITFAYICTASTGPGNCTSTAVANGITTLAANATACYMYKGTGASSGTWYRIR